MANLKGLTFEKQLRDIFFKIKALGEKKGNNSFLSHSQAIILKRGMYMQDFSNYLSSQNIAGKLNLQLTESNLNSFLEERLSNLNINTVENYLSGFNSLLNAFNDKNISHDVPKNYFKNKWSAIKQSSTKNISNEKRGLQSNNVLKELKNIRYESYVIGKLMLEHGYRISEAINIVKQPESYIQRLPTGENIIINVIGKGGKIYKNKYINHKDVQLILNMKYIPSKQTFHRDLKKIDPNLRAHDFRYSFARNLFNEKLKEVGYKEALQIVSKSLNHNRSSITVYYLNRS